MSEAIRTSTDAPDEESGQDPHADPGADSRSESAHEPRSRPAGVEGGEGRARATAAREALAELGDRARAVVEELARHARERREAAERRPPEPSPLPSVSARPAEDAIALLPQRLGEIRAYMGEVADVLEATIERLETVEHQLGDPDENVERQLAEGIARCERVLMGIEHRVDAGGPATAPAPEAPRPQRMALATGGPVLVMSAASRRRSELCVAVERQGLATVAAYDLASALRTAARTSPRAALLDLAGSAGERVAALEEWKDYQDRGVLPPAVAIGAGDGDGSRYGFEIVREEHGAASMAAVLLRIARGEADDASVPRPASE